MRTVATIVFVACGAVVVASEGARLATKLLSYCPRKPAQQRAQQPPDLSFDYGANAGSVDSGGAPEAAAA